MSKVLQISLLLLTLIATGCTTEDNTKLVTTYADVLMIREQEPDSARVVQRTDSLLQLNGYTRESFRAELGNMGSTPQLLTEFYDSVQAELRRRSADSSR